jgi:hypothetical protein
MVPLRNVDSLLHESYSTFIAKSRLFMLFDISTVFFFKLDRRNLKEKMNIFIYSLCFKKNKSIKRKMMLQKHKHPSALKLASTQRM